MKRALLSLLLIIPASWAFSQKVDSIYFHLYTDSLKKGVHNYINVDGKMSDGTWMPLSDKEIEFSTSHGLFEGNDLVIPADFKEKKVHVTATLRGKPSVKKEIDIWIKTIPNPTTLPTEQEIINSRAGSKKTRRGR